MIVKLKNINKISDNELEETNGGFMLCGHESEYRAKNSLVIGPNKVSLLRINRKRPKDHNGSKGKLIGYCRSCHCFVYESTMFLHENHMVICAGGR